MAMEGINNDEVMTQVDTTNTNNGITREGIHYCLAKFGNKIRIDPLFYIGSLNPKRVNELDHLDKMRLKSSKISRTIRVKYAEIYLDIRWSCGR